MRFDGTVNLGHILTIASLLGAGAYAYTGIAIQFAELQLTVSGLVQDVADHEARIRALELKKTD